MALRKRGHQLLIDDVTSSSFEMGGMDNTLLAQRHLLSDAAEALGVDFEALPMLAGGRREGGVPGRIHPRAATNRPDRGPRSRTLQRARSMCRRRTAVSACPRCLPTPVAMGSHPGARPRALLPP